MGDSGVQGSRLDSPVGGLLGICVFILITYQIFDEAIVFLCELGLLKACFGLQLLMVELTLAYTQIGTVKRLIFIDEERNLHKIILNVPVLSLNFLLSVI